MRVDTILSWIADVGTLSGGAWILGSRGRDMSRGIFPIRRHPRIWRYRSGDEDRGSNRGHHVSLILTNQLMMIDATCL